MDRLEEFETRILAYLDSHQGAPPYQVRGNILKIRQAIEAEFQEETPATVPVLIAAAAPERPRIQPYPLHDVDKPLVILACTNESTIEPETDKAMRSLVGYNVQIRTTPGEHGYYNLLEELWEKGQTFVIVEQDNVPKQSDIDDLHACDRLWCAHQYLYGKPAIPYAGLGCTKFSSALMQKLPNAIFEAGEMSTRSHPRRFWCSLDARLQQKLGEAGVKIHIHPGIVGHKKPFPSRHLCNGVGVFE